jgi:acetylornithine deacetylase/succinyl-diaminopimelate desuccinylase-like protein
LFNHVPAGASAYLDFRFIPEDEKEIKDKIIKAIGPDIEMEILFCDSPEYVSPSNSYVKQLEEAATEVTGKKTELVAVHAPSDIRHYNTFNCVGVGFGAKGVHQHADDEWVDIQSLEDYFVILESFLTKLH